MTGTDVVFGTIQADVAATIKAGAADVTTTEANLGDTASSGALQIVGATANVSVSWTTGTLTKAVGGPIPTTFTPIVFNGTSGITSGSTVATAGDITLGVGGTLALITNANAGIYSTATAGGSPVVFTVQYL